MIKTIIDTEHVIDMAKVSKGCDHGPSPVSSDGAWMPISQISDISGLTHATGSCSYQEGACKVTVNLKSGVISEVLIETVGCSAMSHSAAMASEILSGKNILEALNMQLGCEAIAAAMQTAFAHLATGRSESAFYQNGLPVGSGFNELGDNLRSYLGTAYGTAEKGPRYLELAEGYVINQALDRHGEIIGYKACNFGKMMNAIRAGTDPKTAYEDSIRKSGRYDEGVKYIDPREK